MDRRTLSSFILWQKSLARWALSPETQHMSPCCNWAWLSASSSSDKLLCLLSDTTQCFLAGVQPGYFCHFGVFLEDERTLSEGDDCFFFWDAEDGTDGERRTVFAGYVSVVNFISRSSFIFYILSQNRPFSAQGPMARVPLLQDGIRWSILLYFQHVGFLHVTITFVPQHQQLGMVLKACIVNIITKIHSPCLRLEKTMIIWPYCFR